MKLFKLMTKIYIKLMNNKKYISYLRKAGVTIGDNCDINKNCIFGTEPYLITIGNNVRLSNNVQFITHDGGLWVLRNLGLIDKNADKFGKIVIGDNVNIGWNVVIMPNVIVGDNVIIGAGAIVTKNIPSNSVVAGIPARCIESIDEYANKNMNQLVNTKHLSSNDKRDFLIKKFYDRGEL